MIIHSIPYLIRQVRASLIESISHDYYQMAISKGVTKRAALIKHVLPNGLLPIITIISGWLPKVLGGSLIIEVIFNIPGMGRLLFQSIFNDDWNVMMGILLLVSIFTLVFYLIGDIIYARLSPQIRYD